MNYQRIYDSIIEKAINSNRKKEKGKVYYEKHHIIPKSMGGTNENNNVVLLTFKEHYLCHKLLYIIYKNTIYEKKMSYAFYRMNLKGNFNVNIFSGKFYEEVRLKFCKYQSEKAKLRTGFKHSEITKIKLRETRKKYHPTIETNEKIKNSFTEERRKFLSKKILETRKNNPNMIINHLKATSSIEHKNKLSVSIKKIYNDRPELKKIVSQRFSKKVINLNNNQIFNSLKEASVFENIGYSLFKKKFYNKLINYDYI